MLTAFILICSLTTTPDLRACSQDNAVDIVHVPANFSHPATCLMQGQAYLAGSSIGRDLTQSESVKVVCVRRRPMATVGTSPPTR
jgi:hypothetical protein